MLGGLVCELVVDVCESKLLIKLGDTGLAMVSCDGKGKGIEPILRFGAVRVNSSDAGCADTFRNGRALPPASMLAFLRLLPGELPESVNVESGCGI